MPTRRIALHGVDGALSRRATDDLGGTLHALSENIAKTLAADNHLQQCIGGFGVAPFDFEAAELLFSGIPLFLALHDPADERAKLIDVYAGRVDLGVEPGDVDWIRAASGPARP